jgi:hypothetical protein
MKNRPPAMTARFQRAALILLEELLLELQSWHETEADMKHEPNIHRVEQPLIELLPRPERHYRQLQGQSSMDQQCIELSSSTKSLMLTFASSRGNAWVLRWASDVEALLAGTSVVRTELSP